MRRLVTILAVLMLAQAGCGGGDDDGGIEGDNGDGDGDGSGQLTCEGDVSGDTSGGFASCGALINHYPDGSPFTEDRTGWLFTLVAISSVMEVEPPLDSIAVSLELAGEPATGSFALSDAVPDGVTTGVVTLLDDNFYGDLVDVALEVTELDQVTDSVIEGDRIVTFQLHGGLEMTLEGDGGVTVAVSASF